MDDALPGGAEEPLRIAIKMAALRGPRYRPHEVWGDFHFAEALKRAFERLGHVVSIDPPWQWYGAREEPDDVAIVIRGLMAYDPHPGQINVMWNINHTDNISFEEYGRYDLVYVASPSWASLVRTVVATPVRTLLQASDPERFRPDARDEGCEPHDVLFVGNSRGEYRDIVRWAVDDGFKPAVYGTGWEPFVPRSLIRGDYIDNARLSAAYTSAGSVLCDHFASMREFGFVSNRVYDVVASGGTLVCDHLPSIPRLFGDAVRTVRNRAELREVLQAPPDAGDRDRAAAARLVHDHHTFDHRARAVIDDMALFGDGDTRAISDEDRCRDLRGLPGARGPAIHAIVRAGTGGPDDMAYVRLICPLTDDEAGIDLSLLSEPGEMPGPGATACIVQRGAVPDGEAAAALAARLASAGIPLIVDVDDAPSSDGDERLIEAACQLWFAGQDLLERHGAGCGHLVRGAVDPRLWKRYAPRPAPLSGGRPLRLLMIDRPGGGPAPDFLWAALDRVAGARPGSFHVIAAGDATGLPRRPWLSHLPPPALADSYPGFARWLGHQGPFDAGLVLAGDTDPACLLAELRALELGAMGLATIASHPVADRAGFAGEPALTPANTAEAWAGAIERLVADPGALPLLARSAETHVWEQRAVPAVARLHAELIASAITRQASAVPNT